MKTHWKFTCQGLWKTTLTALSGFLCVGGMLTAQNFICDSNLELGVGYRVDNLKWSIAGGSNGPDIMSELEWRDIQSAELNLQYKAVALHTIYLRGNADVAFVFDGQNQDSDYAGNQRTLEYSRSLNTAEKGTLYDLSLGLGMQFSVLFNTFTLAPLLGYSFHSQHLTMTEGTQVVDTFSIPPRIGSFPGLDSAYTTHWYGPWIGLDFGCNVLGKLALEGYYEFHIVRYSANGHWNLRTDFLDDFIHKSNGIGNVVFLKAQYALTDNLSVGISTRYQTWHARPGLDRTYIKTEIANKLSGIFEKITGRSETRLNSVNWHAITTSVLLAYHF